MIVQEDIKRDYLIEVNSIPHSEGSYLVSYCRRGSSVKKHSGKEKSPTKFKATVNALDPDTSIEWDSEPTDRETTAEIFEPDALHRATLLHNWLSTLSDLINTVDNYVKEFGWSTKKIYKPMEDSEIGKYSAPALLIQEETTKMLLEPISRRAPEIEGIVDLYLMPGYDDIASLYYNGKKWLLHYRSAGEKALGVILEAESKPLTKTNLRKAIEEMKVNAQ